MKNVLNLINSEELIRPHETIGVAVSGGKDSMSLLHYLNSVKDELKINVVAINIDHDLRENSSSDSAFVMNYCKAHSIKAHSYKVNARKITEDNKLTVEQGARLARYEVFDRIIESGIVDKIALAHHMSDQAETILLNIFRGTGISGASVMEYNRQDKYIRPLLTTSKIEIQAYISQNEIPYVEDETNLQNDYNRNYIRNMIMPLIRDRWQNADAMICNFGQLCRQDDEYIYNQIDKTAFIIEDGMAKINTYTFVYPIAVVARIVLKALKSLNLSTDIERKHIMLIKEMAISSDNGSKLNLPNGIVVIKEYDYITFTNKKSAKEVMNIPFTKGAINIPGFGIIDTNLVKKFDLGKYTHLVDMNKIPKNAVWRYREDGDQFTKFGGGTKSLSDYLIDQKVPVRIRNNTPVLAIDNDVLIIAGIEISNKVKVDKETKTAYGINVVKM
ncbi:MAG: tRNA lysidine(34) synthetase TilS [Clostridia bacterium]|nr:tRNA lysidine(34) synthetase TilS [Clostridia bacterium]